MYSRNVMLFREYIPEMLYFCVVIDRVLQHNIEQRLFGGKAIILTGPRQVGKTTLLKKIVAASKKKMLILNGDDPAVRDILGNANLESLRQIIGNAEILFIDEAQRISQIGLSAKMITDEIKQCQLILSGSSSFELSGHMQEPLTGRKWTFELFPISWKELQDNKGFIAAQQDLDNRLVHGFYPDVINNPNHQTDILVELVNSYLYKDVLTYANLRKPEIIQKLVQALAYQLGNEVVYSEIGKLIGLDHKTVSNYIDILEQAYVVFRLPSFSRNLRNEIKTNRKVYFYDNGVRNAVIGALQPLPIRQDVGALWENFCVSERLKYLRYKNAHTSTYFWRTRQQQEVDYVEESDGIIKGYEFKWNENRKASIPKTFTDTYNTDVKIISKSNFREFVF